MNNKINLNKLREEIDNRKKGKNIISSKLGESVYESAAPRDGFLHGLIESLNTGRDTTSSVLIKSVDNKVAEKKGETAKLPINKQQVLTENNRSNSVVPPVNNYIDTSQERDELLFAEFEKRKNKTLAESMGDFYPKQNNQTHIPQSNGTGIPMNINEAYLVENVKGIVNNYLIENFGPVVEEAIKSTILEMYAVERIKEVLHENKELIKTIVVETIREIQARNKQKNQ